MEKFKIHFSKEEMKHLRQRIGCTRLPSIQSGGEWKLGTDSDYLQTLLHYWCDGYDWSHKEQELNQYPQFVCKLGELHC